MLKIAFTTDGLETSVNLTEKILYSIIAEPQDENDTEVRTVDKVAVLNHNIDPEIPEDIVVLAIGDDILEVWNNLFIFNLDEDTITEINADFIRKNFKIVKNEEMDNV